MKKKTWILAGCALIVIALAAGIVMTLSGGRVEPENPLRQIEQTTLNIDTLALQYDDKASALDASFGEDGEKTEGEQTPDEQDEQPEEQQPPQEQPPEEPEQPEEPQQPEPQQQEPQQPEQPQPEEPAQTEPDPGPGPNIEIITGKDDPGWDEDDTNGDDPGDQDPEDPGDQEDPEQPEDPEEPEEPEEPEKPEEPVRILTDLRNCTLTQDEVTNDALPFYATIENGTDDMYLRVMQKNTEASQRVLTASGDTYTAQLAIGRNEFTILLKQNAQTITSVTKTVMYQATMADAEEPEKGDNPPTITTNLDGKQPEITNRNFQLRVTAIDADGNYIHANHIRVTLDGKAVTEYTGSDVMEYTLWLESPDEGDERTYLVTVQAWDDNGNSSYKEYTLNYQFVDEGGVTGTATICIDATTVGLGYFESPFTYEIKQDEPASYAVAAALESWGYSYDHTGTLDSGFYLSSISGSQIGKYADPDPDLWAIIERNGVTVSSQHSKGSLGEFDFTRDSGWMYEVNGEGYPGVSLASYYLSDGDTLYLRFTLAKGRDIGGSNAFCGTWIGGGVSWNHEYENGVCVCCGSVDPNGHEHSFDDEGTVTREPTCEEPGERELTCTICGETVTEEIEKLPHTFENGKCTVCGEEDPDHEHDYTDHEEVVTEPTCTEDGEKEIFCVCGEYETESIPATGHSFGEASYDWSSDHSSCTISVSCTNSGCTETHSETVHAGDQGYTHTHHEPTCTEDGYDEYSISVTLTVDGEQRQCTNEVTVQGEAAYGHEFEPESPTCLHCSEPNPDYRDPEPENPDPGEIDPGETDPDPEYPDPEYPDPDTDQETDFGEETDWE